MRNIKFSGLAILGFFFSRFGYGCDCNALGTTFFETMYRYEELSHRQSMPPLTIVTGQVAAYSDSEGNGFPTAMLFEVDYQHPSSGETNKLIVVKGDDGFLCRPYIDQFPLDSRWTLAITQESGTSAHTLSNCGVFWLPM